MLNFPDWPFYFMETSVFVFFAILCVQARRHGEHWLATLVCGAVFGLVIEAICVSRAHPSYSYPVDKVWCIKGAAVWVGAGWGIVAYGALRTAAKLDLGDLLRRDSGLWAQILPHLARAAIAGFLAVGIDLTLDPIADRLGFWTWKCDCLLQGLPNCPVPCLVDGPSSTGMIRYYRVPFDNFCGWFGIMFSYGFVSGGAAEHGRKGSEASDGRRAAVRRAWYLWHTWGSQLLAGGFALLIFIFPIRWLATLFYKLSNGQQVILFTVLVTFVGALFFGYHALRSKRDKDLDWGVLSIPIFFHITPFIPYLFRAVRAEPTLLVAVPTHLLAASLVYTWPSLDTFLRYLSNEKVRQRWLLVIGASVAILLVLLCLYV